MLSLLNRYSHGYVAVPVTLSFREQGGFERLCGLQPSPFEQLVEEMSANTGHLRAALRLFESLGWCEIDDTENVQLTPAARNADYLPSELSSLFEIAIAPDWFERQKPTRLRELLTLSSQRWRLPDDQLADIVDGALFVPLLLSIRQATDATGDSVGDVVPDVIRDEIGSLFAERAWATVDDEFHLTELGKTLLNRIPITGTVASYRPMLLRMDDLLFGDAASVFARDLADHETHVDRSLNVTSSGFQHEKFFRDLEDIIVDIFDGLPISQQPKYVADMGCGDGTLLKRIYECIREKSQRGQTLDEFPVTLIGVDYNEKALDATSKTLASLPHCVLQGDIGDPQRLLDDLKKRGIEDPENILHVRSFLDHDRPFLPPEDSTATEARQALHHEAVHVRRDGSLIDPAEAMQSLVEHLRRWSAVTTRFGLILLEVHCLPPRVVREFLHESENLHFDAYHAFSGQLLVEPDAFLMAAAEAGLFPDPQFCLRYPRILPYTRITLNRFQPRPFLVRYARPDDLDQLDALEDECWPADLRAAADRIAARIDRYPEGQFVLELDGRVVGVVYSQRIDDVASLDTVCDRDVESLHKRDGRFVQLLAANISPGVQAQGLGDQLIEFALQVCSVTSGIERVVGVSRCRDYVRCGAGSIEEYVHARTPTGERLDPILRFHESHGAEVKKLVHGYRPQDTDNDGYGVLIEYDVRQRRRRPLASSAELVVATVAEEECAAVVTSAIKSVLGPDREDEYSPSRPLMEQDLDSMDLLELSTILSRHFEREIDATFFFNYPTPEAIIAHLSNENVTVSAASGMPSSPLADTRVTDIASPDDRAALSQPVAVVGMGCRFPGGADTPEAYWQLLRDGVDAVDIIPAERWNVDDYYDPNPESPGKMYARHGCFVRDIDQFDAEFFGITPREALELDPQQRLLLEVTWQSLEHAGIAPARLRGSDAGVFVGMSWDDATRSSGEDSLSDVSVYRTLGTARSIAAGRIAYVLGLHGPVVQLDTACSSSLVSVYQACQSLQAGECDLALAGGVNLMLSPATMVALCRLTALASDGRGKTFDAAADGYVRGEGCGMVVLKRLSDAVRDGDTILAQITAAAINHDGASNGLTAPNGQAQEQLVRKALRKSHIEGRDVTYVEAHGAGTELGDPIELKALNATYGEGRPLDEPLYVGSTKTNIGHLEAAAGIAGLIKVVLMLERGEIPAHLNFNTPNPHIDWRNMPLKVPTELSPWPRPNARRLAAVSAFGFSGTNAHVILEASDSANHSLAATPLATDASATKRSERGRRPLFHILPVSAQSQESLLALARRYAEHIRVHPDQSLDDLCFSAATTRDHFKHRIVVIGASQDELVSGLDSFVSGDETSHVLKHRSGASGEVASNKIAFLFTGQGTQYHGMGRELYEGQAVFRAALDRCDRLLRTRFDIDLLELLYGESSTEHSLDETVYTQPALFSLQYALVEVWKSWGIRPDVVIGHSLGEYAAGCAAGVFDVEVGLELVATRGRLMHRLPSTGAMAVVMAAESSVRSAIEPYSADVSVASINGPNTIVISGKREAIQEVLAMLTSDGIDAETLNTSHAGHSALIEPMLEPFRAVAEQCEFSPPNVDMIANVSGELAGAEVAAASYWVRQLREPVRFADGMQALAAANCRMFIEIGPNPNLLAMGMGCVKHLRPRPSWLPSLTRDRTSWETMLYSLGELYVRGVEVNWSGFHQPYPASRVSLPTYAFHRQSYPLHGRQTHGQGSVSSAEHSAETNRAPLIDTAAEASRLPGPKSIAAKLEHSRFGLEDEARALTPRLDEIAIGFIVAAIKQLGFEWHVGVELPEVELDSRIPERHRTKVARVLKRLADHEWVEHVGRIYRVLRAAPDVGPEEALETLQREFAYPECDLMHRAGPALAAIWQGKAEPLQVLFPDGATDQAVAFYSEAKFLAGYNRLASEALSETIDALPENATLRVLEVGAGTGGLTMHLLPHLPADRSEYVFTDLSPLFLHAAQKRFKEFPFLRTELLDVSKSPLTQGFAAHSFDLLIAANVLHATPRLHDTLTHVRELLKPSGWLMLLEAANPPLWGDAIFTLIDGWWSFEDKELRPDYPLMRRDRWCQVLAESGFDEVATLNDARLQDDSHNTLYLAQSKTAGPASDVRQADFGKSSNDEVAPPPRVETQDGDISKLPLGETLIDVFDRDELSQLVLAHAVRVMRLQPEEIDLTQPLSELGLDSLMATELRAQLGHTLGRELSLNTLQMRRSIQEITDYIREDQVREDELQAAYDAGLPDLEVNEPRAHLVPLQTKGAETPLFFVPAGYGDLFAFQDIAHAIGLDHPVYGLQPASAKRVKTFRQMSIYRLVSAYISEIKSVQSDGPYFLSGYSAGGIIAVELARELSRQGNEVGLLVIFDPPSHVPFWLDWIYALNYRISAATRLNQVVRRLRSKFARRLFHTVLDEGLRTHTSVTREHRVARYPGRITHFRARLSQSSIVSLKPIGRFWRRVAADGVEVHWIPGTHYGMLRGPGASVVVDELRDCLQRAEASRRTSRSG